MRHVVLDTNALIQALPTRSRYHKVWTDFLAGKYCLCVSNEILTDPVSTTQCVDARRV